MSLNGGLFRFGKTVNQVNKTICKFCGGYGKWKLVNGNKWKLVNSDNPDAEHSCVRQRKLLERQANAILRKANKKKNRCNR